jgi:hypothetical protein
MLVVPLLGLARSPQHHRADDQSVAAGLSRADVLDRLAGVDRANRGAGRWALEDVVTTSAPTTTVAPASATATAAPRRTTTTVKRIPTTKPAPKIAPRPAPAPPPPPTAPPPTAAPAHSVSGGATWYDAPAGTCAMRDAPRGTIVRVTNLANGRTTTCRVADYGPTMKSRVIDLSKSSFAELADPAQGVIQVRVTW